MAEAATAAAAAAATLAGDRAPSEPRRIEHKEETAQGHMPGWGAGVTGRGQHTAELRHAVPQIAIEGEGRTATAGCS